MAQQIKYFFEDGSTSLVGAGNGARGRAKEIHGCSRVPKEGYKLVEGEKDTYIPVNVPVKEVNKYLQTLEGKVIPQGSRGRGPAPKGYHLVTENLVLDGVQLKGHYFKREVLLTPNEVKELNKSKVKK